MISRLQGFESELRGRDLRSSAVLRSVWRQFLTGVSGQPIGPVFKGQEIQDTCRWDRWVFLKRQ
jgi:hypothetical protein